MNPLRGLFGRDRELAPAARVYAAKGTRPQRPIAGDVTARNSDISRHILPTSATMVGVSITIIGIVRLIETRAGVATIIDTSPRLSPSSAEHCALLLCPSHA